MSKIVYVVIGQIASISIECSTCDRIVAFGVYEKDYLAYQNGKNIELALPYVPHYSRLMLVEPICESCRSKLRHNP